MNHISLFTGFMGFDIAAAWAGWNNLAAVENNEYCQRLIKQKSPKTKLYDDIKTFSGRPFRSTVDVVSGGFPCQPFSVSGKQRGTQDDRYLWPEMLRVIHESRPTWVVGENVANIIQMGKQKSSPIMETDDHVCFEEEMVIEIIRRDLENLGYRVEFLIIPACAVGTDHVRNRIWILAYSDRNFQIKQKKGSKNESFKSTVSKSRIRTQLKAVRHRGHLDLSRYITGNPIETAQNITGIPGIDDGFSYWMEQSHGLGNAIVPQLAYEIFLHINYLHYYE